MAGYRLDAKDLTWSCQKYTVDAHKSKIAMAHYPCLLHMQK